MCCSQCRSRDNKIDLVQLPPTAATGESLADTGILSVIPGSSSDRELARLICTMGSDGACLYCSVLGMMYALSHAPAGMSLEQGY
jgi:hypothetical protein